MSLFWNASERRLRAPWRLLLQAMIMFGLGALPIVAIAEPLTALHRRGLFLAGYDHDRYDRVVNMIVGPLLAAAVIASVWIAGRWLDRRRFSEFGVRIDRSWWSGLLLGMGVSGAVMGLVFLVEYAAGWVTVTGFLVPHVAGLSVGLALSFSLLKCLCVGSYEEFVSRGYQLRNLSEGLTPGWGVIVSSSIFALLHLFNDNTSVASTLGLFVNALFFATALLLTGRLSTAIGAHLAWNLVEGAVLGFPVSGDLEGASLIGLSQGGPPLLTGGAFGPEAGLVGAVASLAGIALLLIWAGRQRRA
jgi:hypothetical protein